MSYTRLIMSGTIKKPIPQALKDRWLEIKQGAIWLAQFAKTINEGNPNEERFHVKFANDYVTFSADLAIKNPMPQLVIDKLPQIRTKIRWLMGFVDPKQPHGATYHICYHDDSYNPNAQSCDETEEEI